MKIQSKQSLTLHRGTGLGLAIWRTIIERVGGEIHAEFQPHIRTTISMSLPCVCQSHLLKV